MDTYVRTKDNELYQYVRDFDEYIIATKNGIYAESIKKDNILKEADTIEELCDEFVCNNSLLKPIFIKRNDEGDPLETYHQGIINSLKEGVNYKNYDWFGAIWTDKGLIYVAKMNDKGEMELI